MRQQNRKIILILIISCILLSINILVYINKVAKPNRVNGEVIQQYEELTGKTATEKSKQEIKTKEEIAKEELASVKEKTESERIRYYLGKYLDYIENGEYETAYNILYPDFKKNYFETQEKYEEYVKKLYPELIAVECNDIQRQGEYYILSVTILDPMEDETEIEQKFVIKENNYLDFVLSFQVIEK